MGEPSRRGFVRRESERVVTDDVIAGAADAIRAYARGARLEFACAVGKIILDRFYGGDVHAWRAHRAKATSFRKLAGRLDGSVGLSASALYLCVAIHEVLSRFGGVSAMKHLTRSHVYAVLPLRDVQQRWFLLAAEHERWTVDELERAARSLREVSARGRPRLPRYVRSLHHLQPYADEPDTYFADLDQADTRSPSEIAELFGVVIRFGEIWDRLRSVLNPKRCAAARKPARDTDMR